MNLLTIFGYIIAAFAIALGLFLILRKNSAVKQSTASDDGDNHEPLLISEDSEGQRRIPVIPRHLREQLLLDEAEQNQTLAREAEILEQAAAIKPAQSRTAVVDAVSVEAPKVTPDVPAQVEEESIDAFDQALAQLEAVTNPSSDDAVESLKTDTDSQSPEQQQTQSSAKPVKPQVETASVCEYQGESALLDAHLEDQERRDDESALAQAEHILSLYVMPSAFRALSGDRTMQLLRQFGLRFGEMSLFHRFEDPEGTGPLMFSVLRYTQEGPSGFDLETLSSEQVDGLAFFLALPSKHAVAGYDMMVSIAGLLAREIAGQVFDEQMNELTPQLKEHYRHFVLDYRSSAY
jgi:cell division protein ZipA